MWNALPRDGRRLALTILLGGPLVLLSYTLVFVASPEMRTALWGGVPDDLRGLYTYSMFAATAGFFPFTYLFLTMREGDKYLADHRALTAAYALVLLPSAAWLPLTMLYLDNPSSVMWFLVRADLFAVALGAVTIVVHAVRLARAHPTAMTWIAVLGALCFAWQTVVLDALAWPASFSV